MPSFQGLGGLETHVLEDGEARVEVIPSRGALVTRMNVGGDELLYLDESTVVDLSKNVRGGIPVLFPTAGKLPGDTYPVGRQSYTMPQHGFARRLPWGVRQAEKDLLVAGLQSSEETLKQFPWRFDAQLTFSRVSIPTSRCRRARRRRPAWRRTRSGPGTTGWGRWCHSSDWI